MFNQLVDRLQSQLLEKDKSDDFIVKIPLTLSIIGEGKLDIVEYPKEIEITFNLDIEYKSWGIASINFVLPKIVIDYTIEDLDTEKQIDKNLKIDLDEVGQRVIEGDGFTIASLSITVDKDGNFNWGELLIISNSRS